MYTGIITTWEFTEALADCRRVRVFYLALRIIGTIGGQLPTETVASDRMIRDNDVPQNPLA